MIKQKTFDTEEEINKFLSNTPNPNITIITIETEKYEKRFGDEFSLWYSNAERYKLWYNDNLS